MVKQQQTLIYIEDSDIREAEFMSRSFVTREVKNRAYINAIGAELVMKFLGMEGVDVSNLHNMHSISKILEKFDIADILLPNIYIDVRVIFDENQIFIPKIHFENNIIPNIYAVIKIDDEFKTAEFIGYFKPSQIDKEIQNEDYYFVSKDELLSVDTFTKFVKDFAGRTSRNISEEDMLRGRELSISLADHDITKDEVNELLELLLLNDELRESILEFDNFETLAYSAAPELVRIQNASALSGESIENIEETIVEDFTEDELQGEDLSDNQTDEPEIIEESVNEESLEEVIQEENAVNETGYSEEDEITDLSQNEVIEQTIKEEMLGDDLFGDSMLDDSADTIEEPPLPESDRLPAEMEEDDNSESTQVEVEDVVSKTTEPEVEKVSISSRPVANLSVDDILDQTIASINKTDENKKDEDLDKKSGVASNIVDALAKTAVAGTSAAAAIAATGVAAEAASVSAELNAAAGVSEGAMKLASVSGEAIDDVVSDNIEKQSKNLDKIDYKKTDIAPDVVEMSDNVDDVGSFAVSQIEANANVESSGEFIPKELSQLNKVDTIASEEKEQVFEHETIDMNQMEEVENDLYREDTDSLADMESLTNIDAMEKNENDFAEVHSISENEIVDLPDNSLYTINEDGTSPMDDFSPNLNFPPEEDTENLVDISPFAGNEEAFSSLNFDSENIALDSISMDSSIPDTIEDTITKMSEDEFDANVLDVDDSISIGELGDVADEQLSLDDSVQGNDEIKYGESASGIELDVGEDPLSLQSDISETISEEMTDSSSDELVEPVDIELDEKDEVLSENMELDGEEPEEPEGAQIKDAEIVDSTENISDELTLEEFEQFMADNPDETTSQVDDDFIEVADEDMPQDSQDWLETQNYDNLSNTTKIVEEVEELITEPVESMLPPLTAIENSKVISDKSFSVGEIPIDINNPELEKLDGPDSLEKLYDEDSKVPGAALLNNPGRMGSVKEPKRSPIAGILGMLIVLALVGVIGFFVAKMFKAPSEETPQPITDEAIPTSSDNGVNSSANTLNVNENNVISMDNNTDALASTATTTAKPQSPTVVSADNVKKSGTATSFVDVKKLTWEVPDYISYNSNFKQYFQSVGKSLKLALTSDLLLATDYIYSNQVKVSVTFEKDGTFRSSQIINSSGSTQIDSIVLQTVNQTLKSLKAPHSVGNDESTTAILKIYF